MEHAKYSPSRLDTWAKCPCFESDGKENPAMARGTAIHEYLSGKSDIVPDGADAACHKGMLELENIRANYASVLTEKPLVIINDDCWGTADVVALGVDDGLIVDWKTGWGEKLDAGNSLQLHAYMVGAAKVAPYIKTWRLMICNLDKYDLSVCTVDAKTANTTQNVIEALIRRVKSATPADARANSACSYCAKRMSCKAAHAEVVEATALAERTEILPATAAELGAFYAKLERACTVLDSIHAEAKERLMAMIEAGEQATGYTIREKGGARAWSIPADDIVRQLDAVGLGDWKELKSPAGITKELKALGIKESAAKDMLAGMSVQKVGKILEKEKAV
jgi:hypothetical protein